MTNEKTNPLKQEELDFLTTYLRITTEESTDNLSSLPAVELLDLPTLEKYLVKLSEKLQSPSLKVTASQFSKRYAFMVAAPSLFMMTRYGKALNVEVENCHVESNFQGENWIPKLRINDIQATPIEQGVAAHRDQVVQTIFSRNITKVWEALSTVARIPMSVLWENTAVYVYWLYDNFLTDAVKDCGEKKCLVDDDFAYLLHKAPAALFGQSENPLHEYYGPKNDVNSSGESVRKRHTCCYYYQVSSPTTYCTNCPITLSKN